ncbi:hypothetical protein Trydic_g7849, partial [Trypoxylus dichotomus]
MQSRIGRKKKGEEDEADTRRGDQEAEAGASASTGRKVSAGFRRRGV